MLEVLRNLTLKYDHHLIKKPYLTQMITNAPLWSVGDILAQKIENSNNSQAQQPINWRRVTNFCFYGFFVAGPLCAWWYRWIETRWQHLRIRSQWFKYLAAKITYDQFLFEPPYLLQFFYTMGILQGSSLSQINQNVKENYTSTFLADCMIWPIAQGINFAYVPPRFQAIYVNFISLGWAGFLSWVTNKPSDTPKTLQAP